MILYTGGLFGGTNFINTKKDLPFPTGPSNTFYLKY